jgi:hypothetical protein
MEQQECAESMGRRSNYAAMKDVQTNLNTEASALDMERKNKRSIDAEAAMKGALIESYGEDCAGGMGHYRAARDAQIVSNEEEEFARGTALIAIIMMNLLYLHYHVDQHTITRLQLSPISALRQLLPAKIKLGIRQECDCLPSYR